MTYELHSSYNSYSPHKSTINSNIINRVINPLHNIEGKNPFLYNNDYKTYDKLPKITHKIIQKSIQKNKLDIFVSPPKPPSTPDCVDITYNKSNGFFSRLFKSKNISDNKHITIDNNIKTSSNKVFDKATVITSNPFNRYNLKTTYKQSPQHIMIAKKDLHDVPSLTLPPEVSTGTHKHNIKDGCKYGCDNSFNNPLNILNNMSIKSSNNTVLSSPYHNSMLSTKQNSNNNIFKNNITTDNPILHDNVNNKTNSNNIPLKSLIIK